MRLKYRGEKEAELRINKGFFASYFANLGDLNICFGKFFRNYQIRNKPTKSIYDNEHYQIIKIFHFSKKKLEKNLTVKIVFDVQLSSVGSFGCLNGKIFLDDIKNKIKMILTLSTLFKGNQHLGIKWNDGIFTFSRKIGGTATSGRFKRPFPKTSLSVKNIS